MLNNESADILRLFDTAFEHLARSDPRLHPRELAADVDALNAAQQRRPQGGVASSRQASGEAVAGIFDTLDQLEVRLTGRVLFGDRLTETDIRLFVTRPGSTPPDTASSRPAAGRSPMTRGSLPTSRASCAWPVWPRG